MFTAGDTLLIFFSDSEGFLCHQQESHEELKIVTNERKPLFRSSSRNFDVTWSGTFFSANSHLQPHRSLDDTTYNEITDHNDSFYFNLCDRAAISRKSDVGVRWMHSNSKQSDFTPGGCALICLIYSTQATFLLALKGAEGQQSI